MSFIISFTNPKVNEHTHDITHYCFGHAIYHAVKGEGIDINIIMSDFYLAYVRVNCIDCLNKNNEKK